MKKVLKDIGAFIVLALGIVAGVVLMFESFKLGGVKESIVQIEDGMNISGIKLAFGGSFIKNLGNVKLLFNIFGVLAIVSPILAGLIGLFSNKTGNVVSIILFVVGIASILILSFTGTTILVDLIAKVEIEVNVKLAFLSVLSMILSGAGIVISAMKMA